MKKKKNNSWLLFAAVGLLLIATVLLVNSATSNKSATQRTTAAVAPTPAQDAHNHQNPKRVPAFEVAPIRANLGPTLDPERFTGMTRDAYRAVRQIPVTIAQLPCYCHCDEGFGHKSLYSCFQDDHAAHCDVCVREALLALTLEKEQRLNPAEIRQQIVEQYSR